MSPVREGALVAAPLGVMALELVVALRADGLTVDAVVYIAAGNRQLLLSDYRDYQQPPLSKMIGALPLLALGPRLPPITEDP